MLQQIYVHWSFGVLIISWIQLFLPEIDFDACATETCGVGEGDCDNDDECGPGLKCGVNNCPGNPLAECCFDPEADGKKEYLQLW